MLDISFFELLVIAVVALVVIGPERLPEAVRGVSLWIGRFKRSLRETRSELERQIGADDIRRQLHNEEVMQSLEKTRREIEAAMRQNEAQIASLTQDTDATHTQPALPAPAEKTDTAATTDIATSVVAPTETPDSNKQPS
ncbi:Sec-independent protein translocase protein TatB [Cellvibrio polysaccharolyticus]|uniref:Sec-independent protein translocase protein TatB n=1 Tax=Cellvibrio polysaccharolyticus TaxID=2082724 RepID=A0A928V913_9GAMM|nr:Sec-independent protein translocase protein TatB [Cellvibrio polysaccharolyticus]MBE8718719.1 twin-arginine translocase subunit TatB [Cellvibrio polysaccharolyticus]